MKNFWRNIRIFSFSFIMLTLFLIGKLYLQQQKSQIQLVGGSEGNIAVLNARYEHAGPILSSDGIALAYTENKERKYSQDPILARAALHVVGDYTGRMNNTIEALYQTVLFGSERKVIDQIQMDILTKDNSGDSVVLTIDSRLMKKAYELMGEFKGSIVLLNYKTGAVYAMVSTPSADPQQVIAFKDLEDSSLVNRAINGQYMPGSTFKIINASAFIQSDIFDPDRIIACDGNPVVPYGAKQMDQKQMGPMNLKSAFATSCNTYFGRTAIDLGEDKLEAMATSYGYNQKYGMDRLHVSSSKIDGKNADAALTSWLGIGQPASPTINVVTPLELALFSAGIANDGKIMKPHIVDYVQMPNGNTYDTLAPEVLLEPLTLGQSKQMQDLMRDAVLNGLSKGMNIAGYEIGGKTGTAENGEGLPSNALMSGYIKDEQFPLAISIVIEDGGHGGDLPVQFARQLLEYAIFLKTGNF